MRTLHKLSARAVSTLKEPGRHSDGGGLYLSISDGGRKRWVFLYARGGRQREMGLGPADGADAVSLAEARMKASSARETLKVGMDPLEAKQASQRASERAYAGPSTFGDFADAYIETMGVAWRNAKHRAQWVYTLTVLCAPIREKEFSAIGVEDVLSILAPIWTKTPETASRLRGRIEAVLDAARAKGLRSGENPARWRGHLSAILPKRAKLTRGHHAAMPYADVPAFMAELRARDGVAARMLEFVVLTAARTGEALGATWREFDLDAGVWTVPAIRMKAAREHRVPLSPRVLEILREMGEAKPGPHVFPGRGQRPLSNMAMVAVLKRMKRNGVTVHGFRSAFRDWAAEATPFPRDVCEAALAHTVRDKVEAAYRRGDLFDKRRELMAAWAAYCEPKPANVVAMARRR